MCMGFGCNAAGVTACRIIESPRERLIAILTNCLRFMVSFGLTREKCSGGNVGMPAKRNFLPGVVMVSPMEKMPGSNTPMISPA